MLFLKIKYVTRHLQRSQSLLDNEVRTVWCTLEKMAGPLMNEKGDFIINDLLIKWLKLLRKFGIDAN